MSKLKDKLSLISGVQTDRIAPFVLAALILVLCWKLAAFFWWVVAPPQVLQVEPVSLGSQQATVPNISGFALFAETGRTAQAAESNLNMQLQGVVVASPIHYSSAVIKLNDQVDRYVVGESIENSGYRLAEVYWDHIVLRQNNGEIRELKFNSIENLYQPLGPDVQAPNTASQNNSTSTQNSSANGTNVATNNTASMSSSQRALGQAIDQIQENREQYLKNMGVNANGGQGYEVTDQTPAALKNKLGLKSGDRILSLNGQTVGQGQNEAQLLEQAKRERKVRIEVKRGDQVMTFQQDL